MRILIVDDSRVFRSIVKSCLEQISGVSVVGSVWSGEKALEFLCSTPVDLVTLDIEMPGLDGIETLRLLKKYVTSGKIASMPNVIMLSSLTDSGTDLTIRALELGAYDFIPKQSPSVQDQTEYLHQELQRVVEGNSTRSTRQSSTGRKSSQPTARLTPMLNQRPGKIQYILIGVSTGGPKALAAMLPELSRKVECPILIVQHMPPLFTKSLASSLDKICVHTVVEAQGDEEVSGRNIYIAPGGMHLVIRKQGSKIITSVNNQPPEAGCRPSVDVLFRSASNCIGNSSLAIILTGMGVDGSAGIRPLKRAGTTIFVQDESSSVVWGMPGAAVQTGLVDKTLPLMQIPEQVATKIRGSK